MKSTFLALALAALAGAAQAQVLSMTGRDITYVDQARRTESGEILVTTTTVFVGESLLKEGEGLCFKHTARLAKMNVFVLEGLRVELPEMEHRRERVACAS